MDGLIRYDIRDIGFEDFVVFLFDHEVVKPTETGKKREPWFWHAEVEFEPQRVADFYVTLFTDPSGLANRLSDQQLEQAFWAIPSINLDCSVKNIMWDGRVSFESRERCVRSMEHLFGRLFAFKALDTSVHMWWDALAYDWHCGNRSRENGGEDRLMQDVMFETLTRILQSKSETCQGAALHGLGHLHHPHTALAIADYLERSADIDQEMREYALAASKFEVM